MMTRAEHACPGCGGTSALYDVVDFNKNCLEKKGFWYAAPRNGPICLASLA